MLARTFRKELRSEPRMQVARPTLELGRPCRLSEAKSHANAWAQYIDFMIERTFTPITTSSSIHNHLLSLTSMLSSFIDVSLCSVNAAHMHSRVLSDQTWILLWSRLMVLAYASHRLRSFSNPDVKSWMCGAYAIFKVQPDAKSWMCGAYAISKVQPDVKDVFRPRLNFSNPSASWNPVNMAFQQVERLGLTFPEPLLATLLHVHLSKEGASL